MDAWDEAQLAIADAAARESATRGAIGSGLNLPHYPKVEAAGFEIQELERMRAGVVERLIAVKTNE